MKTSRFRLFALSAALALPAAVSTLHAQTATYTKIEDSSNQNGYPDVNPAYGQPHELIAAFNYSLVGNNLLFGAEDGFLTFDLYKATVSPNTFAAAVDESTTMPGDASGSTFGYSSGPSLDPTGTGNFVFGGRYANSSSSNTANAIYASNLASAPGVTTTLVSTSTVAPGQGVTFNSFGSTGSPSANISGTNVVFQGQYVVGSTVGRGVYATSVTGGTPTKLADYSTAAPSGGTFTSLTNSPQLRGNTAVFTGSTNGASATGLYAANVSTGVLTTLVSTSTAVPGQSGNFTLLNAGTSTTTQFTPAMNNTQVAFQGNYGAGTGVFRIGLDGTGLVSLGINTGVILPGTGGFALQVITGFSLSNTANALVFTAGYNGSGTTYNAGLFLSVNGVITKLLTAGDSFDGSTIGTAANQGTQSLRVTPNSFNGSQVAFEYQTAAGTIGTYEANVSAFLPVVPEPSTWAFVAIGAGLLGAGVLRRRPRAA